MIDSWAGARGPHRVRAIAGPLFIFGAPPRPVAPFSSGRRHLTLCRHAEVLRRFVTMRDKTPIREQVAARKTASPQRVKPLALGDLAKRGTAEIEAECEWCRHAARIEVSALLKRAGAAALYRDIVKKLRCSVCGWNRVEAWPVRPGRSEAAKRRVGALPPLDECRALLAAA